MWNGAGEMEEKGALGGRGLEERSGGEVEQGAGKHFQRLGARTLVLSRTS